MITRAKFQNFKALRDVEVTFDSRLTVIVGPNGSGKTSVLQGIHALSQLAVVSGQDPDVSLAQLTDFTSIGGDDVSFEVRIEGSRPASSAYSVEVDRREPHRVLGTLRADELTPAGVWYVSSSFDHGRWQEHSRHQPFLPADAKRFDSTAFIRFSAGQLASPTLIRNYPPQVAKNGSGLAATLNHIKSKYPERLRHNH